MLIYFADFFKSGKIMDEAGVNHAIRGRDSTPQAIQIPKITPMDLGAGSSQRLGVRI
jgi:hypothetical protein